MKAFDCTEGKKYFFIISTVLIVAGIACAILFGGSLSGSNGYDCYTADISDDFSFDDDVTASDVSEAAKSICKADRSEILMNYSTGGDMQLRIEGISPFNPDIDELKSQLETQFEGIDLGDFASSKVSGQGSTAKWLTAIVAFAVMLAVVWIVAAFTVGIACSYFPVALALHDLLITLAFFIFFRAGDVRIMVACGAAAVVFSAYFNITELLALNSYTGKGRVKDAAIVAFDARRETLITFVIFALLISVVFAVVSLINGSGSIIPLGCLLSVSLITGVYSSCCIAPNLINHNK